MPSLQLLEDVVRVRSAYEQAARELAPLLMRLALETVADVLPGAAELQLRGEVNEDWLRVLRMERVLDDGTGAGEAIERAIDDVNSEYLDLLLDVTGDEFLGSRSIAITDLPS